MNFHIRSTRPEDTPNLPAIEQSAGELFRTIPELAWIADGDNLSAQRHLELLAGGACWVAETGEDMLAAFLSAEVTEDALHIWELSVLREHHRKGIGRALMAQAIMFAGEQDISCVTLTTFRGVPWNEPMYKRFGFRTLSPGECDQRLEAILDREIVAGLPAERRCAMRLRPGAVREPWSNTQRGSNPP